jgi:hypothetical protein
MHIIRLTEHEAERKISGKEWQVTVQLWPGGFRVILAVCLRSIAQFLPSHVVHTFGTSVEAQVLAYAR